MSIPFRRPLSLLLALSLSAAGLVFARAQKKSASWSDRENERRSLAVNIVRAINTAEASYKTNRGAYATWDTLMSNGDFSENGTKWANSAFPTVAHAMYGPAPEIVPGWKLRLQLSKEGNAYDLRLEDVSDTTCGFAVISDDTGVIRQSKTIDCPIS